MPRQGWKGVNIPEDQYNDLARIVEESPQYTSVPEVVRAVIAKYLTEKEAG